ncbi:MAG: 1-acyl-sn-glycerol-3-phosphate acyltransferase [Hyphomicrobiales bacterium]|nr:1-acyl-sn-glycerol-3-phosphate acyltransferase [Hyphomicrobiales bacterium]
MRSVVAAAVLIKVLFISAVLVPTQWIAMRFGLSAARQIPPLWHRMICRSVGLRVILRGTPVPNRPLLIAANHVSWLDIPVIGSVMPLSFIAKAEVNDWPIFGPLARLQRTIFIDRTRRARTGQATAEIATRLNDGDPVVLFAEGTSSDGNRVLAFRSALLGATRDVIAGSDDSTVVQPLAIAYIGHHGMPLGRFSRPNVAWYGDMEMASHVWQFLKLGPIDVVLHFAEPIAVDGSTDRKALARNAEIAVRDLVAVTLRGRESAA